MEAAFRAGSWWRDRWSSVAFRRACRSVQQSAGSLVLLAHGLPFDMPAPFEELFEPIEIGTGFGGHSERLKTLSGETPTRQERRQWIVCTVLIVSVVAFAVPLGMAFYRGLPPRAAAVIAGAALLTGVAVYAAVALQRLRGRWFLVPGGVAIVRRPARRGGPARVTVLGRADACLLFRYVHTGKTSVLTVEIWAAGATRYRRAISDREAVSLLAAWQSPHEPPDDERLQELVTYGDAPS